METDLFEFAYVPDWYGQLEELEGLVLPEPWKFKRPSVETKNQDTPIEQRLNPLFPLDVWEHAYYLQYQNRRDRYLNAILKLINWKVIEQNYHSFP